MSHNNYINIILVQNAIVQGVPKNVYTF